jgi:hypothetical protein
MIKKVRLTLLFLLLLGGQTPGLGQQENSNKLLFQQPDTTGVWYHISENQRVLANNEFERLKYRYPDWQPVAELIAAIARLNTPKPKPAKNGVINTDNKADTNNNIVSAKNPLDLSPLNTQRTYPLLDKIADLSEAARKELDDASLQEASANAFKSEQKEYHVLIAWTYFVRKQYEAALEHFGAAKALDDESAAESIEITYKAIIDSLIAQQDWRSILSLLENANSSALFSHAEGQAWSLLNTGKPALAFDLFSVLANQEGRVLSLDALGKETEANILTCNDIENKSSLMKRCADYLSVQQYTYYDENKDSLSILSAQKLAEIQPLTKEQNALLAWAAKRNGENDLASRAFEAALTQQPKQQDIAQALVELHREDKAQLRRLASLFPIIQQQLVNDASIAAWYRKQFLLTDESSSESQYSSENKSKWTLLGGIYGNTRTGEDGLDRLDENTKFISLARLYQHSTLTVTLDYKNLYSGKPSIRDWFGDQQILDDFNGISGFDNSGVRLEWLSQKAANNIYVNLEYALIDQPVPARLSAMLASTWYLSDTTLALSIYRQSKADSLLSRTGTFDGQGSQSWGAIRSTGAAGLASYAFKPKWAISGTIAYEYLDGEQVKTNQQWFARVDLSHDIASVVSDKLDYLRVGPYISQRHYQYNLSGYIRARRIF